MNSFTLLLYGIGGIVVIYFLLVVLTAQNILGVALKKSNAKIIPRPETPDYISAFFGIKETQLLNLGFSYHYCILTEGIFVKECPQQYIFMYYHPQEKTYAGLTASTTADYWMPFQVSFETHFKNGKKLVTFNGLKHSVIDTLPNTILIDAYAETLEKHFQFHLQHLARTAVSEGEIEEFNPSFSEEMLLEKYDRYNEDYLKQLEQKGITYKLGEDKYGIKTLASLGIAFKMIAGMNKINALRKKNLAQKGGDMGTADIPVELELANYRNTRSVLTPPIKNTPGKIFFLLMSFLFFAGAFTMMVSFEFMALLAAAIVLHESGHLLAMRLLGYKNLKMLFIPLFGAMAMGSDKDVPPYKKVISYFAGPTPGILLGFLLLFQVYQGVGPVPSASILFNLALMLLAINYFNLIPVLPFDGGQVFNTIIFSRFASLQILFYLVSILVIALLAIVLSAPLLFFIAILIGVGLIQSVSQRRIMKTVKNDLKTDGPVPGTEVLKKIFLALRQAPYRQYPFKKKFQVAQNLETALNTPKASIPTVMFTIIFYFFLIGAPIIYLFGLGPLRGLMLGFGSKNPWGMGKNPCEIVARYKPGPDILSQVNQSDFRRLADQPVSDSSSKVFRFCLFSFPGSSNMTDRAKDEAGSSFLNSSQPGTFLGKLWALYGRPDERENGFSYTLLDRKNNIIFHALVDQGVPVYAGQEKDEGKIIPGYYRFEALLKNTEPVDCHYAYKLGENSFEIGVAGGKPFFEPVSSLDKETLKKEMIVFPDPVPVSLLELPRMLSVYRALFAIGHDRWLTSEASQTRSLLEVTGLPAGLTKEQQLALFPAVNEALGNKSKAIFFEELKTPRAAFMTSGVYPDPANQRLLLVQGLFYTQDDAQLAQYLTKIEPPVLAGRAGMTVEMEFLPGDYGDSHDLGNYYLYLKGYLTPGSSNELSNPANLEITGAVGPVNSLENMRAWIEAAKFFAQFETVHAGDTVDAVNPAANAEYRFDLIDENEARQVKQLCLEVSENLHDIAVTGKCITVDKAVAELLGFVVTYHRYGRKVMDL